MINVIFPAKYCSSSAVLRALPMGVGRTKALGAVLSLAPGAGAQPTLGTGLAVASPSLRPGLVGTRQVKAKRMLRHRALPAPRMYPSLLFPSSPTPASSRPGHPCHPAHTLELQACHTSIVSPSWAGPCQAHLHHMWRLLPYHTLQRKVRKRPAPRGNPRRLCKAGLAPPGQTHPAQASQEGAPILPSRSTGVTVQLPLLVAVGTRLQLLPYWDSPGCKTPAMIEACGWGLHPLLEACPRRAQCLSFPRVPLMATSGKSNEQNLRQTFWESKNLSL